MPNPLYGSGGSSITADLKGIAPALAGLPEPTTILYADQGGACTGYQWFVEDSITGVFKYWDAAGNQYTCDPPIIGQVADFAFLSFEPEQCPVEGDAAANTLPSDVKAFPAVIHTLSIITDKDSQETSISAEALYFIYGFGASSSSSEVEPWLHTSSVVARQPTAFSSLFLSAAIGIPSDHFVATPVLENVIGKIVADGSTNPDATLGYVSGSAADARRADVKTLAFQAVGQSRGYWPDSDQHSLDKINVRKGQYALWTPGYFLVRVDQQDEIVDSRVANLVGWFDGTRDSPEEINVPQLVSQAGDVPLCAMYAMREGLLGPISSYVAPDPCHCFFEVSNGEGEDCEACDDNDDCGGDSPECRHGYCESY